MNTIIRNIRCSKGSYFFLFTIYTVAIFLTVCFSATISAYNRIGSLISQTTILYYDEAINRMTNYGDFALIDELGDLGDIFRFLDSTQLFRGVVIIALTLVCITLLPILQNMYIKNRSREIAIRRLLGGGKIRTFLLLKIENFIVFFIAVFLSLIIFLLNGWRITFFILGLSSNELDVLVNSLSRDAIYDNAVFFAMMPFLFILSFVVFSVMAILTLRVTLKSSPLKLLRDNK